VPDENGSGHPAGQRYTLLAQHVTDSWKVVSRNARGQVMQGEHAVGLAAAEVGLQLDDGVAPTARQPPASGDSTPTTVSFLA